MCDDRDALSAYLKEKGINCLSHYPIAIADQKAYEKLNLPKLPLATKIAASELSLPMYYGMTDEEIDYIVKALNEF